MQALFISLKKGCLTLITCPHTTSKQKRSLLFGLSFACLARAKRVIIMGGKRSSPMNVLSEWVKKQSMRMKICLGAMVALLALVALKLTIHDLNHFYVHWLRIHLCFGDHACLPIIFIYLHFMSSYYQFLR